VAKIFGVKKAPRRREPARNPPAFRVIAACVQIPGAIPSSAARITPETEARMTRPRTSSITAAPKMIRASFSRDLPMSWSTRAVIPTLVAHRVAPRKAWA
jgi:hypothetical protein